MRPRREPARNNLQTYFLTFVTADRQPFFRHERPCALLLSVLQHYRAEYLLHDFVFMPDHIHLLVTPLGTVERTAQLIKGSSSFPIKRELDWSGKVWQPGYSDHRLRDAADLMQHLLYIRKNQVSTQSSCTQRYNGASSGLLMNTIPPWLKPHSFETQTGRAEAQPFQSGVTVANVEGQ